MSRSCYVYAIVRRYTKLPSGDAERGLGELALVPWRGLAAVVGQVDDAAHVTVDAVVRHEAVVESVSRVGRALPVRFGAVFRDAASVASALAESYEALERDIDRLGDKVELSLTALWKANWSRDQTTNARYDERTPAPSAGARYLQTRAAELRRDEALIAQAQAMACELNSVLAVVALETRTSLLPTHRIAVRAAYLVDVDGESEFKAAFESVRAARRDVHVLLTGPWPPYSFVSQAYRSNSR